jgi:putative hydrolase of the HAD superfamily
MEQPQVIFLDAVGTLFDVKGSVGEVYSKLAREAGVMISPEQINWAFRQSFKTAPPPVFANIDSQSIHKEEFTWWEKVAKDTFTRVGAIEQFNDFNSFFFELYSHFATEKPWYIYEDVVSSLTIWNEQGIELGIISNFDTRIYKVLELLDLEKFFMTVTISSLAGAVKPDSHIFLTALKKHNCYPNRAWHIGDSLEEDYYGAKRVGIQAFWLERA